MSDINFDPPQTRGVDYSERTDPDSGGGMNFVFYDQGNGKNGKDGKKDKPRKPVDFGAAVEVELSSHPDDPEQEPVAAGDDIVDVDAEEVSDEEDNPTVEVSLSHPGATPENDDADPTATTAKPPAPRCGSHINITV